MKQTGVTATITAATKQEVITAMTMLGRAVGNKENVILLEKTAIFGQDATTATAVFNVLVMDPALDMKREVEIFLSLLFPRTIAEVTATEA